MIASIEEAERLLRNTRYVGLAPRPLYMLPFLRLGLSALLTRETADLDWADRFGTEMYSLEEQSRSRAAGSPGRGRRELLEGLPALVGTRWRGREFRLASYGRFGERWPSAFEELGARLLAPSRSGNAAMPTDKIAMRDWFRQLGVPVPASLVTEDVEYPALRRQLGTTFVAQRPRGTGGTGTFLITDLDTARALPASERWLVSEYAGDTTVNVHGFVDRDGVPTVLQPSVQLTDVAGIGSAFGRYSGSDFLAPTQLSEAAITLCTKAMGRIGWGLGDLGYRGLFGVDFAIRGDTAAALEINCRMQGSSWLLGEIEFSAGGLPTAVCHVLEGHGLATTGPPELDGAEGTQLIIRHHRAPERVHTAPSGGVYRLSGDRLVRRADGYGLLECGTEDCVLLNIPRPATLLNPGGILARIVSRKSMSTPDGKTLNDHGTCVVGAVHALFHLRPHMPR
jgi:hypothetical protein